MVGDIFSLNYLYFHFNFSVKERLNPAVRSQICGELHMRNLPELCDSLDNLDITISFLKSVGPNPNMSLSDFMENTLKIDKPLISTKV